jgi:hypothetical protein
VTALFALLLFRGLRRSWLALAGTVLVLELGMAAQRNVPRMPGSFFRPPASAAAVLEALQGTRLFHEAHLRDTLFGLTGEAQRTTNWALRNGLYPATAAAWGIESVLEPDHDRRLLPATRDLHALIFSSLGGPAEPFPRVLLDMSNVGLRVAPLSLAGGAPVPAGHPSQVGFLRDDPWPRYYFAEQIVPLEQAAAVVGSGREAGAPSRVAVMPGETFQPAAGEVLAVNESANGATLRVRAAGRALLVVSVTAHRHWKATIDGRAVALLPANVGYQAVVVPPGEHTVGLRYHNPFIPAGAAVSAVTILLLLSMAFRADVSHLTTAAPRRK